MTVSTPEPTVVTAATVDRIRTDLDHHLEMGPGDYAYIPAGTVHTESTGVDGVDLVFARDRRGGQTRPVDRTKVHGQA